MNANSNLEKIKKLKKLKNLILVVKYACKFKNLYNKSLFFFSLKKHLFHNIFNILKKELSTKFFTKKMAKNLVFTMNKKKTKKKHVKNLKAKQRRLCVLILKKKNKIKKSIKKVKKYKKKKIVKIKINKEIKKKKIKVKNFLFHLAITKSKNKLKTTKNKSKPSMYFFLKKYMFSFTTLKKNGKISNIHKIIQFQMLNKTRFIKIFTMFNFKIGEINNKMYQRFIISNKFRKSTRQRRLQVVRKI